MKRSKRMFVAVLTLCLALSMALASVTVNAATKKPKKIYLKTTASTVDIKGKVRVTVKSVSPKNASKAVKYKSSNKKVATVSSSGYVTGKKKGTVKITVTSKKNKKAKKTVKIKVKDLKASSVTLNKTSAVLFKDMKTTLKATVKGSAGFYNQGVTWKSSNANVASVDSKGNVTAKSDGTAKITATEKGGSKTATCTVTVKSTSTAATVDTENKSVTIEAVVTNPTTKSMHYIVSSKGNQAGNATMVTSVSTKDFAEAMNKIATPWNSDSVVTKAEKDAVGSKIYDLANAGTGSKNYTKLDVTISYDGTTTNMQKTLKNAVDNSNFSMIYANTSNDANAIYGCITCNTSCYSGIVANEFETTKNPFTPTDLPAAGTTVTITFKAQTDNYVSAKDTYSKLTDLDYVILDVRSEEKYKAGHAPGAISAPSTDADGFKTIAKEYGNDHKYILICNSGNSLAQQATKYLIANGISNDNIFTLGGKLARKSANGGAIAWEAEYKNCIVAPHTSSSNIEFANGITAENLQADMTPYTVLDVRAKDAYVEGHIPGAISAPSSDEESVMNAVKANPGGLYVLACYSGNSKAKEARDIMVKNNISEDRIIVLQGGMNAWKGETARGDSYTNAADTFANLKNSDYVILDVRTAENYKKGHAAGSISVPSDSTEEDFASVVENYGKDKKYILICNSGNKLAQVATDKLLKVGVDADNILTLGGDDKKQSSSGGIIAWKNNYPNYTVAEHTSSNGTNFQNGITVDQLKADFDGEKVYTVLDVRPADKYNEGHIEGAINTPYTDEETLVNTVKENPDGLYVLACVSGNTMAKNARDALVSNGVSEDRIICLQGGMNAWADAGYPTVQ